MFAYRTATGDDRPQAASSASTTTETTARPATVRRTGSSPEAGAPVALTTTPPPAYRITYLVKVGREVGTEVTSVRRPFESRVEVYSGSRVSGEPGSVRIGAFAAFSPSEGVTFVSPPGVAPADVRLDPLVGSRLGDQVLQRRERRRVAGRSCTVYRSGASPLADVLREPTSDDHVDTCVDAEGLVLEVLRVADGRATEQRVATEVDVAPAFAPEAFTAPPSTIPIDQGGGLVREVDPASRPLGPFFELASAPEGFTRRGRYSIIPTQPEVVGDPTREGERLASVSDVFVRGIDIVVLDQGAALRGGPPFKVVPERAVDLAPLGRAEVQVSAQGSEVRATFAGGRYLRLRGTLPPEELMALARTLEPVEGTGLVYR